MLNLILCEQLLTLRPHGSFHFNMKDLGSTSALKVVRVVGRNIIYMVPVFARMLVSKCHWDPAFSLPMAWPSRLAARLSRPWMWPSTVVARALLPSTMSRGYNWVNFLTCSSGGSPGGENPNEPPPWRPSLLRPSLFLCHTRKVKPDNSHSH